MSIGIVVLLVVLAAPTMAWTIRKRRSTKHAEPSNNAKGDTPRPKHRWWQP
ncbi:MAG: hypothetical protein ABSB09_12390 [Acidimicrobiales bacterium]